MFLYFHLPVVAQIITLHFTMHELPYMLALFLLSNRGAAETNTL